MLRLPAKYGARLRSIRNQVRRITRTPALHLDLDLLCRHCTRGVYDFQHRITVAVTEIDRRRWIARAQVVERERVRIGKIADVDVIAHAGSVRRWIVVAENSDVIGFTLGRF